MAEPSAILFDLDDTLTDRRSSIRRYCSLFLEEFGTRLRPAEPARIEQLIIEADRNGYNRDIASNVSHALPWQIVPHIAEIGEHWDAYFPKSAVETSGMTEVIEHLHARDILLGIVTNGLTHAQETKIKALGIQWAFKTVVISESEGCKKPDPRIFATALTRLGHRAKSVWFVGDHPDKDVKGAHDAGLTAVWLRGHLPWPADRPIPQLSISSLRDLPPLLLAA